MDKKQSLELCAALSNAKGAPGFEDEVLAVLRRYGEGLGSFREDSPAQPLPLPQREPGRTAHGSTGRPH